jgi:hypothetical protein
MTKAQSPHVGSVHKDSPCRMPHLGGGRYSPFASSRASRPLLTDDPQLHHSIRIEAHNEA